MPRNGRQRIKVIVRAGLQLRYGERYTAYVLNEKVHRFPSNAHSTPMYSW